MRDLIVAAAVAFVVTVDPVGLGPIFVTLTRGSDDAFRRRMAIKGTVTAAVILFAFAFLGEALLRVLHIGFPAFRVAGGILLLLLAIDMVFARESGLRTATEPEREEASHRADIAVFPLAIPLIAGPGTMTSIVLFMGQAEGNRLAQAAILCVLGLVLLVTLLVLLAAGKVARLLGVTGVNVISRVLGILLAALACQFIIDGIRTSGLAG